MIQTIVIKNMAFNEVNSMYDNTPSPQQFNTMFNQAIAKINADANINLPLMYDKGGERPDGTGEVPEIPQEEWDNLVDFNGVYTPLSDEWVRRLIIPYIGWRTEWIEEGANSAEAQGAYGDFMMGMRELKSVVEKVVPTKYITVAGRTQETEDDSSGDVIIPNLDASPFSGGLY